VKVIFGCADHVTRASCLLKRRQADDIGSQWSEDEVYLYAVTADNGKKVAKCKAQDGCKDSSGANRLSSGCCLDSSAPRGQGKGEGAIVIRDDALVYKKAESSTGVPWKLKRGDAVVGRLF